MAAALLLSGGMDSAALAWWKRPALAINVDYGQRPAAAERRAATMVAGEIGMPFETLDIDLSSLGAGTMSGKPSMPGAPNPEWWPFRNQLLLTFAAAKALQHPGIDTIWIGSVKEDRINGDGSPEFRGAIDALMRLQEGGIGVDAPAAHLSAAELIEESGVPPEVLGWTHSCFVSNEPCLGCRGCSKHLDVLEDVGRRW